MTALIVAACIAAGILGGTAVWLILAQEDARAEWYLTPADRAVTQGWPRSDAPDHRGPGWPVNGAPANVPGRDAPESPATTGPAAGAPPWQREGEPGIPAGGSSLHSGVWADRNAGRFDSALGSPAHDHALASTGESAAGLPTLANPDVPPGDTAVPGPASLPEGDEPAARPPQEAPAREPSPDPLTAARNAMAAVARLEPGEYLEQLDGATAYDGDAPWNPFSDVTLTRIQAIRDGVA